MKIYFIIRNNNSYSFTLFIVFDFFLPNNKINKLDEITNRLSLYLSYVRYKALIDDKYSDENNLWHKKRWTIKFF